MLTTSIVKDTKYFEKCYELFSFLWGIQIHIFLVTNQGLLKVAVSVVKDFIVLFRDACSDTDIGYRPDTNSKSWIGYQ